MLVTPELVVTKAFSRFINQKKMIRQLDRIVIDEYHVVLESTDKWRLQMK
jgi:superfamily II DNA helicase RecQ